MRKPWEETWAALAYEVGLPDGRILWTPTYVPSWEDEEMRARVKLAAAAPDLYRALQLLVEQDWEGNGREIGENETKRRVMVALSALKKARGPL